MDDLPRHVRRKGGRFRAVVAKGDGTRHYGQTRATIAEALADAEAFLALRNRSTATPAGSTIADAWKLLQAELARSGARPGTVEWATEKWKAITRPGGFVASAAIAGISRTTVEDYVRRRRAKGVSESTIWRSEVALVRRLVREAVRAGILERDPLADLRAPRFRRGRFGVLPPATIEQVAVHLERAGTPIARRNGALVRFLASTGVRRAELARMCAADVDLVLGRVRVDGKTGHRWIPLVGRAAEAARLLFFGPTTRPTGHAVRSVETIETVLRDARRATGVPISAHVLRHSFATQAVRAGVQPFVLASLLGHAGIAQTWRYYHSEGPEQVDAMRRIGEALGGHGTSGDSTP